SEPLDSRAGHIPGARSAPAGHDIDKTGQFLSDDELRQRFARHGVTADGPPVAVYCGSGITASHEIAALAIVGISAALYPGSYSQWSGDPTREIEIGA
ncbi:MAG: sulfurtransferase, partial [Cellulomonadaceae bacterium]|nr:sulfurtransferase [Cellulomonadaceae bacterium]